LYRDENFPGKLPYTVAKNESDNGAIQVPAKPTGMFTLCPQGNFAESVYIDYRIFDKQGIAPRYEFGFSLSCNIFTYSNLKIGKRTRAIMVRTSRCTRDLWDNFSTVQADMKNSGSVEGKEVVQLRVGILGGPIKRLRGFWHQELTRRDPSIW
jgi:beta-glucosidase